DAPNELVAFTPFQVGPPDVAGFRAARSQFTADEWAALMLQSAGYAAAAFPDRRRSEEHTSELQSLAYLVCRLLLEKKKKTEKDECLFKKTYINTPNPPSSCRIKTPPQKTNSSAE